MTLYAIGDVQGCARTLNRLLRKISFNEDRDHAWFVGDLVNRGPASRKVLKRVMSLGDSATVVLGNHDLHLLATAAGARSPGPADTFADVLNADDADDLIQWLRERPLLHLDPDRKVALVHAGIYPGWTIKQTAKHASEVEAALRGRQWRKAMRQMYGSMPARWSASLPAADRRRFTINALTRMRFCTRNGRLDFADSGPPGTQSKGLVPWFDHPDRHGRNWTVVFGHWSALGLVIRRNIIATDTGCVWGRKLTAVMLDPPRKATGIRCAEKW